MDISIVVAFLSKNFGIGNKGKLPWPKNKEDMKQFQELTSGHVVVMGKNTWNSIDPEHRPLKNRLNVILSSTLSLDTHNHNNENVKVVRSKDELDKLISTSLAKRRIFIIGGSSLYRMYMNSAKYVYATHVCGNYDVDTYFPNEYFHRYEMIDYKILNDQSTQVTYEKTGKTHDEFQYLELMDSIVSSSEIRPDRTGTGIYSTFGPRLEFDISKSLPLLTTKFVSWKTVLKELIFFLKGHTNTKILEEQQVNIWKGNTTREFLDNRNLKDYEVGDMGPMYGWIWRHIGAEYKGCDHDYTGQGIDQLNQLIKGLKEDPYSRRHLLTTYCPIYVDQGVLPPCHGICTQFYVENDKTLSCHVYLRSNDVFLGQPYNIASYAMMTHIIAKKVDLKPGRLIMSIGDCHVYANHYEQALEQLKRSPYPFPAFVVKDQVKEKDFADLELSDFDVVGYVSHPIIKAPLAV